MRRIVRISHNNDTAGRDGKFQVRAPYSYSLVCTGTFIDSSSSVRYEYVRNFERDEMLLPNTWIVVRVDGRGFISEFLFFGPFSPPCLNFPWTGLGWAGLG